MTSQEITSKLVDDFKVKYGPGEVRTFFAPGRVNLIGEHIDYNGGFVFPCALDIGTYAVVRKRQDQTVHLASQNMDLEASVDLKNLAYDKALDWMNYPLGVLKMIQDKGHDPSGFDVLFYGNIPNGSGLSSSASLEVLTATLVNALDDLGIDPVQRVQISQDAENKYVGVNCGIMDQFAVGMGARDQAILLDCNSLDYDLVPLKLPGTKIVIANTKKRRGLADSKYNERRSECESALAKLQEKKDIQALCDLSLEDFNQIKDVLTEDVELRRARHAVSENERVKEAVQVLKEGKLDRFGQLLNASHASLKEDYEVTGVELDTLAEAMQAVDGVYGARMTGAGFGGCTVSLVKEEAVPHLVDQVGQVYEEKTGLKPEFYVVGVGIGASETTQEGS